MNDMGTVLRRLGYFHIRKMWWNVLVSLLLLPILVTSQRDDCSQNDYDRCVRIADPLIKEAHLVFPDNLKDIDLVCRTWNRFVDCLKSYTDNCFTAQQRKRFNSAVESPIESVHQMCMQTSYQKEYLHHAPCIKSTIVERIHCGPHYNVLVDQVEQGEIISTSTLCCSQERFKQCVQQETGRLCDRGNPSGPASRFATQIIDKALSFLQDQCVNHIPNSGDCPSPQDSLISYSDRSLPTSISTASSEVYPWSTAQQEMAPKEILPSRMPKVSTSTNWLPSSGHVMDEGDSSALPGAAIFPTQNLGSRTRPASYGRSNSWATEPSSSSTSGNTLPMFPGISSTPPSFRERYGTVAMWDVRAGSNNRLEGDSVSASPPHRATDRSTTTFDYDTPPSPFWNPSSPSSTVWYPAVGNQINNEVDEPNQLGLKKPQNGASSLQCGEIFKLLIVWAVIFGSLTRTFVY